MRSRIVLAALMMLAVATLAACRDEQTVTPVPTPAAGSPVVESPGAPPQEQPTSEACRPSEEAPTVSVEARDFTFDPPSIEVAPGDVVGWTNAGSTPHTATLDDGSCSTPTIPAGQVSSLVFEAPGTYPYHCDIHPAMTGVVTVTE